LQEGFDSRFSELLPLFSSSFPISEEQIDALDRNIHMESTGLKYSTILKWKFEELFVTPTAVTLSSLGKPLPDENYLCLRRLPQPYICPFARAYLCE
jgi:hypothetical protein